MELDIEGFRLKGSSLMNYPCHSGRPYFGLQQQQQSLLLVFRAQVRLPPTLTWMATVTPDDVELALLTSAFRRSPEKCWKN